MVFDSLHTKLVNLLTAKNLYECGMLDDNGYILMINEILETAT